MIIRPLVFSVCADKYQFNKIENPADLIKIAIFDLWVDNADRGRPFDSGYNYNLLITEENDKEKIVAMNHAFIFGGHNPIGNFYANAPVNGSHKLHTTPYYKSIIRYIREDEFLDIVENFIPLLYHDYNGIISQIVNEVSEFWEVLPNLDRNLCAFLGAENRLKEIKNIIKSSKS